jgi:hypothetical protein
MDSHPASVQRLLTAIRKTGEFPAMAQTVGAIGALTSSEGTASATLADSILQDYGLTQKLLRLVNTVGFGQYDEVTTITRAVLLLGFERIRTIATSLILFDHISRQARTPALVDILNMSFYSAILGRNIAEATEFTDGEETFLSSLFHRLGRVLVAFYLPEEFATIETRAQTTDRETSVREVLGFGQTTSEMKPWFEVPIRGGEDLFSLAITSQKDIVVRDLAAVEVVPALPDWYPGKGVADGFLLLLPLVVDQRVVGVFYVDGDKSLVSSLTPSVTNYLKVLRGQAVLAIKQKAGARPARR